MKNSTLLTVTSVISILLLTAHVSWEIAHGMEQGGLNHVIPTVVVGIWLCVAVQFSEHLAGRIFLLLGSILAVGVAVIHWKGGRVGAEGSKTAGAFWFIWGLYLIGVNGVFSFILSVRALLSRRQSPQTEG